MAEEHAKIHSCTITGGKESVANKRQKCECQQLQQLQQLLQLFLALRLAIQIQISIPYPTTTWQRSQLFSLTNAQKQWQESNVALSFTYSQKAKVCFF